MFTLQTIRMAAISATLLGSWPATSGAVVVVGTGDPAQDVPAVQAAVDLGGTVTLSGTFDFGMHEGNHIIVPGRAGLAQDVKGQSTVFIYRADVMIEGETDIVGNPLTTIHNGMPPFWIGWDGIAWRTQPPGTPEVDFGTETLPQDVEGRVNYRDTGPEPGYLGPQTRYAVPFPTVSATVRHIRFESPQHYAVKATAGVNIVVQDNMIANVRWGGLIHLNNFAAATHIAVAAGAIGMFYAPFIVPAVAGDYVVESNRIVTVGTELIDIHAGECFGIACILTNATVTAAANTILNVGRNPDGTGPGPFACSIMLTDNYGGTPLITSNTMGNCLGAAIWDYTAVAAPPALHIIGNLIEGCAVGVELQNDLASPTKQATIEQNLIRNCGSGVTLGLRCKGIVTGNTIASCGDGLWTQAAAAAFGEFRNNLLFENGCGLRAPFAVVPALISCNDIWGSTEGDYCGIASQMGVNGNFSAHPLFCDIANGVFTLAATSPCLPGNHPDGAACGLIGSEEQGCSAAVSVEDVAWGEDSAVSLQLQAWPNPSSFGTSVHFRLVHEGHARVVVYDIAGRLVRELSDAVLASGSHELVWDGHDISGRDAAAGVYLVRISTEEGCAATPFVMIR